MSDELRAAAELIAGWRPFAANEIGVTSCDKYIMNKMIYVARAYIALLAEHPADDAEPVTEEWLRSEDFCEYLGSDSAILLETLPGVYLSWKEKDGFELDGSWVDLRTRGDVRRLLRALQIPLKEQA